MAPQRSLRKKFNILLLEAINEALSSLGESPKTAIYYHLETDFDIKKKDIPNRTDDFSRALEKLFGLGARHLEILFMKSFYAKVGGGRERVSWEWGLREVTFRDYVRLMRQSFDEASKKGEETGILININEKLDRCN